MSKILSNDDERKRLSNKADQPKSKFEILQVNTPQQKKTTSFEVSKPLAFSSLAFTAIIWSYMLLQLAMETHELQNDQPLYHVKESWFGFFRDDSDFQWREYRSNLPLFLTMALFFIALSNAIKVQLKKNTQVKCVAMKIYYIGTGFCFLIFVFGTGGTFMWFVLTSFNYLLQKFLYKQKVFPYLLWALSVYTLYYNYYFHEEPFHVLIEWVPSLGEPLYESYTESLVPWYMVYNMTLLRVISFCMDKHWFAKKKFKFDFVKHLQRCDECTDERFCYKNVSETYTEEEEYSSLLNYYSYLMYIPLLITGPQITFNAFVNQVKNNQTVFTKSEVYCYTARALNNIFVLELFNHITFASALGKVSGNLPRWIHFSPVHCYFMGVSNLIFIWLKFLTIWRIARSIALLDGINCPENMNRCVYNNYCFEGFWRSWHRGFNQWLIRYIFIPLGGTKHKLWNIWVVFTFVAIWHDFNENLILWAWMICASLMPEIAVKGFFNSARCKFLWKTWWFKFVAASACSVMLMLMVIANLIGFGNGWESEEKILDKFVGQEGVWGFFVAFSAQFLLALFIFYRRDVEALTRKDISGF